MDSERNIQTLQDDLGHHFKDENLLRQALIHSSFAKEQRDVGEVCVEQDALATVGDAVLKAILTDRLYSDAKEKGTITNNRIELEKNEYLAKISQDFGIGPLIEGGHGATTVDKIDESPNVLARTFEAIVGAVFLDSDYETTRDVVLKLPRFRKLQPM